MNSLPGGPDREPDSAAAIDETPAHEPRPFSFPAFDPKVLDAWLNDSDFEGEPLTPLAAWKRARVRLAPRAKQWARADPGREARSPAEERHDSPEQTVIADATSAAELQKPAAAELQNSAGAKTPGRAGAEPHERAGAEPHEPAVAPGGPTVLRGWATDADHSTPLGLSRRRVGLALAALVAVAVVIGVAALRGSTTTLLHRPPTVRSGPLIVGDAAPWQPVTEGITGPTVRVAAVLAANPVILRDGATTALAGPLLRAAAVPGGPPPNLDGEFGRASTVGPATVGGHLAETYAWQLPGGQRLVGYILPTDSSDLAILCLAGTQASAASSCERLAASTRVVAGTTIVRPGPATGLQASLTSALRPVVEARAWMRGQLSHGSLSARADALSSVVGLEQAVGAELGTLSVAPRNRASVASLASALDRESSALGALAVAARSSRPSAYDIAASRVRIAGVDLQAAERGLAAEGIALPRLPRLAASVYATSTVRARHSASISRTVPPSSVTPSSPVVQSSPVISPPASTPASSAPESSTPSTSASVTSSPAKPAPTHSTPSGSSSHSSTGGVTVQAGPGTPSSSAPKPGPTRIVVPTN